MGAMSGIRLEKVWFRYGKGRWVLKDVTVEMGDAGITAVVGPNGAGKTTLLKIASIIYRPVRGRVIAFGTDPWVLGEGERLSLRRRVVYVHEKPILLRGTVERNVMFGLEIRGIRKEEAREIVRAVAEELGITELLGHDVRHLSAGQGVLVSIARALAVDPRVLVLDEPFAHLDYRRRGALLSLLRRLRDEGKGLIVSTHDTHLMMRVADKVVVVDYEGVREGPPSLLDEFS